jgi:hypothetical protein
MDLELTIGGSPGRIVVLLGLPPQKAGSTEANLPIFVSKQFSWLVTKKNQTA